ncbi:helix-turn-helix protein [Saccharothrix saharensis]|uniref:Helix-turn-helix protein n=1 Tax=Saccharothrix saharensis TaxID=571190 RepID=A0A543JFY0_9PSEU|nr:helix-turn-helix transcriptional regulator [Saccharothrix saharensis]TQM81706.1 helix-turn-helix protein [Saccharothrix saharensis]
MSRRDTVALKWLLGATLRNHRKAVRKTLEHSAAHLGVSESKISNMESGRYGQPPDEVAKLLAFYGADPDRVERIAALAREEDPGSWWAPWSGVIPNWLRLFAGLEGMAHSAFVYSPLFVHALLQTEEYATAVASSARRVRPVDMDRMVAFRLERQRRLVDDQSPLRLHFVIEETALRRPIGGKDVLRRQAEHLLAAAELPTVDIQVIRAEVGMHPGLTGEFTLFGFEEFDETVYVELQEDAVYLHDSAKVRAYSMTANTLRDVALDRQESVSLIRAL